MKSSTSTELTVAIYDPFFIPKPKDVALPSDFWIFAPCGPELSDTQEKTNAMKRLKRKIYTQGAKKAMITTVSSDWNQKIKSMAVWDIDDDSIASLLSEFGQSQAFRISDDKLSLIQLKPPKISELGTFSSRKRRNADRPNHRIYVFRLRDEVLKDKKFRKANPDYVKGKPCYYVGMTSKTPEARFAQHQSDHRASTRWGKKYGLHLARRKFEHIPLLSKSDAEIMEANHAEYLRSKGYGVWQK